MAFKGWKLMEEVDIVVRPSQRFSFTGYVVEHGDKKALESAKSWAKEREWDSDKKEYKEAVPGDVHTFKNEGFTAKILDSAGGSSQGGRLSFWQCEVEKDGVSFKVGVNDSMLADLIKNSDIKQGVIQQKVMFARNSGSAGLIHEKMDAYQEALKDMESKNTFKKAKKTNKWEIGGVYQTLTQTSVCLGQALDTLEEYQEEASTGSWYGRRLVTKFKKADKPKTVYLWVDIYRWKSEESKEKQLKSLSAVLEEGNYINVGKPPARAKTKQFDITEEDIKLIKKKLASKEEWVGYYGQEEEKTRGRYKLIKE